MPGPSPDILLRLWEEAEPLDAVERAVALASLAGAADTLALGVRDARLLELVGEVAGPALESVAACPACGEQVSIGLDVDELLALGGAGERDRNRMLVVRAGGHEVTARCLDSRDMASASATGDVHAAERLLLERCVVRAEGPAGPVAATSLPPEVQEAVAEAVGAADPLAEVLVDLACPACGEAFTAEVDVAAHTWTVVRGRARSLLADVDALARAYGWTEPEVLALSETRRAAYLALVGAEPW